jgi:uncharacterized membrane protein YbjE (DUF340 family)
MKGSLIIVGFFVLGLMLGINEMVPEFVVEGDLSTYALYALLFLVGITVGADKGALNIIKNVKIELVMLPLFIIVGTMIGVSIASLFLDSISVKEAMAVGAGFGYYSLSSILITEISGETLGAIALLSNIIREIVTLLFAPVMVMAFGKLAPIAAGGATSMDSTLSVVKKFSGKDYVLISIFSGTVLTVLVPFLVSFILEVL